VISFVITSYNRGAFLRRTVQALRANIGAGVEYEVVITDDGSDADTLAIIEALKPDQFIANSDRAAHYGLGYNMNKGFAAARGDFHFCLQDDFMPVVDLTPGLLAASDLLRRGGADMVRFDDPHLTQATTDKLKKYERALVLNGRVEVVTMASAPAGSGVHCYSDRPHMRSANFQQRFGSYIENHLTWETEIEFRDRYNVAGGNTSWIERLVVPTPIVHIGDELSTRQTWGL